MVIGVRCLLFYLRPLHHHLIGANSRLLPPSILTLGREIEVSVTRVEDLSRRGGGTKQESLRVEMVGSTWYDGSQEPIGDSD